MKKIMLAYPRGFCAGVRRALDTVETALSQWPDTVYVFHEIVHNEFVVGALRRRGVIFVDTLSEVPEGALVIFSAHGVGREVETEAGRRKLKVIDATCPLVKKIHRKAAELLHRGYLVFLIGDADHPEIQGTLGQLDDDAFVLESAEDARLAIRSIPADVKAAFLTQTTLCESDTGEIIGVLRSHFPALEGGGDICYATANRQHAIRRLAELCDTILVIGSPKSSNSSRLREVAAAAGARAFLISDASEITPEMLTGAEKIGISAGASAPEYLVRDLCGHLRHSGWPEPETIECAAEKVSFPPPPFPS